MGVDVAIFGHFNVFCPGMFQGTDHTHTPDEQQNPED
jgi:hypothetical protein